MKSTRTSRWTAGLLGILLPLSLLSCQSDPDTVDATQIFIDCLERNGVVAEDVEVSVDSDGTVSNISATIVSEGDVAYEPTVRMACTQEVEANY